MRKPMNFDLGFNNNIIFFFKGSRKKSGKHLHTSHTFVLATPTTDCALIFRGLLFHVGYYYGRSLQVWMQVFDNYQCGTCALIIGYLYFNEW